MGSCAWTVRKACESVMTRSGALASDCSIAGRQSVVQHETRHLRSSSSRSVWTCGRIRRPFGAWMSCGMTSRTVSPLAQTSAVMLRAR